MSPLARVNEEVVGEVAIVAIEGEIDASNAAHIGDHLRRVLTNRSAALIVDLAGARYIDSAGINVLFELDLELRQRRQELHLVVPDGSLVARMLVIAGLGGAVTTHATRAAALEQAGRA
jgi:anti-anti-sigma factor